MTAESKGIAGAMASLPFVMSLKQDGAVYSIKVHKRGDLIATMIELVRKLGGKVAKVTLEKPSLDQVFLEYTGQAMRDEQESPDM